MDVIEAIKTRRSIRSYEKESISEEDLSKILEAATWAPSAGNLNPWEFVVIRDEEKKRKLSRAAFGQYFISESPVVVVVCANVTRTSSVYGERGRRLYCIQDCAAATQNLLLAAHSLSYGACWVGAFDDQEVIKLLKLPSNVIPLAIVPIGKPKERPVAPRRLPLSKVVHYETYI
ncbi:MAG: nitroreductase family protein [Thermoproteota archaeon]|nr:nitroreductase family protein [Candidatus Brockarchaeota archaeon]MBO3768557.1 nitroreductase family protein [Candidatus Brockarchaeota archaeon]MBO3801961.1 nitroreductase family protein [Candidatus Brockarchaeota archaeon]